MLVVKKPPANAEDVRDGRDWTQGSIPGLGRTPGGRHGHPLWYSCLENSMDRGAWWAEVHRVAKSQRWRSYDAYGAPVCPKLSLCRTLLVQRQCLRKWLKTVGKRGIIIPFDIQTLHERGTSSVCQRDTEVNINLEKGWTFLTQEESKNKKVDGFRGQQMLQTLAQRLFGKKV